MIHLTLAVKNYHTKEKTKKAERKKPFIADRNQTQTDCASGRCLMQTSQRDYKLLNLGDGFSKVDSYLVQ